MSDQFTAHYIANELALAASLIVLLILSTAWRELRWPQYKTLIRIADV